MILPIEHSTSPNLKADPRQVILVVEDNPFMRNSLCDLISQSHPGCTLLQANSAEKAIELVSKQAPDLVLMDIALPGMDGLTCLVEIKKLVPAARSVVISYHEEPPYIQCAKEAGADAYVAKRRLYLDLAPLLHSLLPQELTGPVGSIRTGLL